MVSRRYDVDSIAKKLFGRFQRYPETAGGVFAVGDYEVRI